MEGEMTNVREGIAPGSVRVIRIDPYSHEEYPEGDYMDPSVACAFANERNRLIDKMGDLFVVVNDHGTDLYIESVSKRMTGDYERLFLYH